MVTMISNEHQENTIQEDELLDELASVLIQVAISISNLNENHGK